MARQLNIRSDEAFETAKRLAERQGLTTTEVVVRALRYLDVTSDPLRYEDLSAKQKSLHDRLAELARKAREAAPDATSDHSEFYGEDGAPK